MCLDLVVQFLFPFKGWWVVPLKVAFDQTIWSAIWNSIYFITLGLLRFESPVRIWKDLRSTFFPLLTVSTELHLHGIVASRNCGARNEFKYVQSFPSSWK